MEHLTEKQINKLTYYYLNKKILTNDLVDVKKHMAQCQSCYEKFCVSVVAAHELRKKGFFDLAELIDDGQNYEKNNFYVRINNIAGRLKVSINEALDSTVAKLWNFVPELQPAVARGTDNKEGQTFVNDLSVYSTIFTQKDCLIVRLDDEYFSDNEYEVVYIEGGEQTIIPFTYNEMEECLEVVIKVKDSEYELIIRERKV